MENFILNTIVNVAIQNGFTYLKGEYLPTPKNEMVKDHYFNLGFKTDGDFWLLSTYDYNFKKCFIEKII